MASSARLYGPVKYSGVELSIGPGWISSRSSPELELLSPPVSLTVLGGESCRPAGGAFAWGVFFPGAGGGGALVMAVSCCFWSLSSSMRCSLSRAASFARSSWRCAIPPVLAQGGFYQVLVLFGHALVLFGVPQCGTFPDIVLVAAVDVLIRGLDGVSLYFPCLFLFPVHDVRLSLPVFCSFSC